MIGREGKRMPKVVFATGNAGKMREIRMILEGLSINGEEVEVLSMKEAGVEVEIEEDGKSFVENAIIKAKAVAWCLENVIVLADDSGLEIDYLNKEPGIYSARYMGEDTSYHIKNMNLISRLEGVKDEERSARFVCAIACVLPGGELLTTEGVIEGRIGYE